MYKQLTNLSGILALALLSGTIQAQPANLSQKDAPARKVEASTQRMAVEIQQKIEQLDAQRQADFQEWRQVRRELLLLDAYNQRQAEWNQRLERLFKVKTLTNLLTRVDVSHAEKLRQLLTAYRNEVEQGRALSVSKEFIQLDATQKKERLTLVRLGRIGLYYLSEDEQRAGYWSAEKNTWLELNSSERQQVIRALALAEERGLPEFLTLPLSVPLRTATSAGLEVSQ